ncbi:MAG: tetratricopeptide repeat protein [candidate division KSB1 bacterium]|nr:tetratricopeptide repeat protein [candidate division KSB1 bacterium]MDZ7273896.1 tetratricopeptide repeat protein [candidate division KSB1 bacterium]MDZ7286052.1 tetratricopeptide repeat protein [candidate division KSB1 bacterium]MDZ7299084.1 tetratricopeptide repeat protein [candidate division KSB1 bacterium]MDZ7306387.1 tetratricopeptide repeat protein [candidate division KSB1 bacterium]
MQARSRSLPLTAVLLGLSAALGFAQVRDPEAVRWYNAGVAEKDAAKAIAAYQSAVARDSTFVEALFALGLAYNNQRDFVSAHRYLSQAIRHLSPNAKNSLRVKIYHELANAYFGKGELSASEEALRQALALAKDSKLKTSITFKLARLLCQQNRLLEALAELKARRQEDLKNKDSFDSFIALIEKEIAAAQAPQPAQAESTSLLAATRPVNTEPGADSQRTALPGVTPKAPLSAAETAKQSPEELYQQALALEAEDNLEMAQAAYEALLQRAPNFKDARLRLQGTQRRLLEKQIALEVEQKYTEGLAALRASDWLGAIAAFERVLELKPDYGEVSQQLAEARRRLDQENTEEVLARYYGEGLSAMRRGDLGRCLVAFEKVRRLDPNYREVAELLAQVESEIQNQRLAGMMPVPAPGTATRVDSLYDTALRFMQQNEWKQAVVTLEKLRILAPNHAEINRLLAQARLNLSFLEAEMASVDARNDTSRVLTTAGMLVAIILVPMLSFLILSPSARARLHLLLGDFPRAARLYERLLAQKPSRVHLYPVLANIYLLAGRRDENAMKIYKTVLQLDLPLQNREQINAMFTQHYLANGRSDSETIKALESALQVELNRKSARREA